MKEVISDISDLIIGHFYTLISDEPHGEYFVGKFKGYEFRIGEYGKDIDPPVFLTELPPRWEERYPAVIFDYGRVDDFFMFYAMEETEDPIAALIDDAYTRGWSDGKDDMIGYMSEMGYGN